MPILLIFFTWVVLELWLMVWVAAHIGALPTVLLTIVSAVCGMGLMRQQGLSGLIKAQQKISQGESPAREVIGALASCLGGLLLLIPGFITDGLGLLLMVPGVKTLLAERLLKLGASNQFRFRQGFRGPGQRPGGRTYEGEYERADSAKTEASQKNDKFLP